MPSPCSPWWYSSAFDDYQRVAMKAVLNSRSRLSQQCDYTLVEGAGSPAEINLRDDDWPEVILRHLHYGGKTIGICGGFQMSGRSIDDPQGIEGPPDSSSGLGLMEVHTLLEPEKKLEQVSGTLALNGAAVVGYQVHCGVSTGALDHRQDLSP